MTTYIIILLHVNIVLLSNVVQNVQLSRFKEIRFYTKIEFWYEIEKKLNYVLFGMGLDTYMCKW